VPLARENGGVIASPSSSRRVRAALGSRPPSTQAASRIWFRPIRSRDILRTNTGEEQMTLRRSASSIVFAVLAVFCFGPSSASEMAVSQYGRVTATLPWAVAVEKGFFAAAGIKIDNIISGQGGGTTLRNMLASDLPYGEVATSAALAAIRSGLDIVIVNTASDHIGEIALVANPKSSIHSVQDLQGRKAGFTGAKSTSELLLRLALKEAHMTDKVEPVATGGFGGGLTLLDTGGIDAAPLIDPILTLKPDSYRVIFHFADLIPRMTWLVGVTTRKFAQQHPDTVRKLIAIHRQGVDYIYAHHDEAIGIYAKVWQQEPKDVATYFPKYFDYKGEWSPGGFDPEALAKMSDGLQLIGDSTGPVDWKAVIDQQFLPADLQKPL
jgi:NitT/TauT family transport system substrate-binding protein